jgi:hypothetical protein
MNHDSVEASSIQLSQSQVSAQSQPAAQLEAEEMNPFLKRKPTQESFEARKKEIVDHVEKFGIKKKADVNATRKLKS